MAPIDIDGTDVSGISIDGTDVQEVTMDGGVVWQASAIPDSVVNLGGYDGSNNVDTIYAYDPDADSISTQSATLPTALRNATSAAV